MTDNVKIYYADLPCSIRGFVKCFPDNFFGIVLNSRLSYEQNKRTLEHELEHIKEGHLYTDCNVDTVENLLHTG